MATLSGLPLDVLLDTILPSLPVLSLLRLAATCRAFHSLITGPQGALIWRSKAEKDFHFPVGNTARRTGWLGVYKRLKGQSCFVWGQNSNGRLGISPDDHSTKRGLMSGGLPVPTPLPSLSSYTIVGLESSGFSFHALTSTGSIISWGTMDGENFARGGALSHVGFCAYSPFEIPATKSGSMGEVVQLEAGRKHVLVRNNAGEVWEYRSFGRAYKVSDANSLFSPKVDPVTSISAGWTSSAILTRSNQIFIWWEPAPAPLARLAAEAGEGDLQDPSKEGVCFEAEMNMVQLPEIPGIGSAAAATKKSSRARPSFQPDRDDDANAQDEHIASIATGASFLIALTNFGRLFHLDISPVPLAHQPLAHQGSTLPDDSPERSRDSVARLVAAYANGERRWREMRGFGEMKLVGRAEGWDKVIENGGRKPERQTRITSISAHFRNFVAYSVSADSSTGDSIVLMGDETWNDSSDDETLPTVVPELQGKGVIKIAQGDYHYLALTSSGELFSWGAYSAGALGLGHPQLLNTPLSAPHPPPRPSTSEPQQQPIAPFPMPTFNPFPPRPNPIFPGFTPGSQRAPIPPPPEKVDKPTRIIFPGENIKDVMVENEFPKSGRVEVERTKGKFVFAVTASGWHSGCLAVELEEEVARAEEKALEDAKVESSRDAGRKAKEEFEREMAAQSGSGSLPLHMTYGGGDDDEGSEDQGPSAGEGGAGRGQSPLFRGGLRPFRIGFPGRGIMRGAPGIVRPRHTTDRPDQ
ncbi:RCC1/BLIP-II [Meredithblackwellia eburnea MCA 4105]